MHGIRRLAHQYGSVKLFKAYHEYPTPASQKSLSVRSELTSCGVALMDCPHNGRKDVADKMIMSESMLHFVVLVLTMCMSVYSRHDGIRNGQSVPDHHRSDIG